MTVIVRFSADAEGRAAVDWATRTARSTGAALVVHTTRDHADAPELPALDDPAIVLADSDDDLTNALIDASYDDDTEILVLGLRRRSPVAKLILGSMAQRILLEAGCPVMAVKPEVGKVR